MSFIWNNIKQSCHKRIILLKLIFYSLHGALHKENTKIFTSSINIITCLESSYEFERDLEGPRENPTLLDSEPFSLIFGH